MMQDFQGKFDQFASNNIVGCGLLTTVFYEDSLYCLTLFFQILSPLFLQTHTHTHTHTSVHPTLFVALFLWLNGWFRHIWCYFTWWHYGYIHAEPWYLSTTRTLQCVFMQHGVSLMRSSNTWHGFLLYLISHTHTQTKTQNTHTRVTRLRHPCKYILTPPVMCSQHLSVSQWINNLLVPKIYFTEFQNVFAF